MMRSVGIWVSIAGFDVVLFAALMFALVMV
jgi:hypothetical protein